MGKITLEVNDKHLSEVLLILKSLKTGMITKIQTEDKNSKVKIQNSTTASSSSSTTYGRYLSPEQFKQKLNKDKS